MIGTLVEPIRQRLVAADAGHDKVVLLGECDDLGKVVPAKPGFHGGVADLCCRLKHCREGDGFGFDHGITERLFDFHNGF